MMIQVLTLYYFHLLDECAKTKEGTLYVYVCLYDFERLLSIYSYCKILAAFLIPHVVQYIL